MVDRHRAVAGDPNVRLTAVALHHHRLAAAISQLDAVVVVDDLRIDPTGCRRERPHL